MIHGTSDNNIFMFDYIQFLQKYSVYSGLSSQTQKLLIIDSLLGYANIWILVLVLKSCAKIVGYAFFKVIKLKLLKLI
jgi:hypothetical protein